MLTADDYAMAMLKPDADFWALQRQSYMQWSGRYTATLMIAFNNLIYKSPHSYRLFAYINIAMLIAAVYFFSYSILHNYKRNDKKFLIATIFLAVMLMFMPSAYEGIYWAVGVLAFNVSFIGLLVLFGLLVNAFETSKKFVSNFCIVLSFILTAIICGLNEIAMICLLFSLGIIIVYKKYTSGKLQAWLLILLLFAVCCSIVMVAAPGNVARLQGSGRSQNIVITIAGMFYYMAYFIVKYGVALLLFFLVLMALLENQQRVLPILPKKIWRLFTVAFVGLIALLITLQLWSTGSQMAGRAENIIFQYMMLVGFVMAILLAIHQKRYLGFLQKRQSVIFIFIIIATCSIQNVNIAYVDLLTGTASTYKKELTQQNNTIAYAIADTVTVNAIHTLPKTLSGHMLADSTEPDYFWVNTITATYYGKKMVWLQDLNEKSKAIDQQIKDYLSGKP
jgi:hypothetical protein